MVVMHEAGEQLPGREGWPLQADFAVIESTMGGDGQQGVPCLLESEFGAKAYLFIFDTAADAEPLDTETDGVDQVSEGDEAQNGTADIDAEKPAADLESEPAPTDEINDSQDVEFADEEPGLGEEAEPEYDDEIGLDDNTEEEPGIDEQNGLAPGENGPFAESDDDDEPSPEDMDDMSEDDWDADDGVPMICVLGAMGLDEARQCVMGQFDADEFSDVLEIDRDQFLQTISVSGQPDPDQNQDQSTGNDDDNGDEDDM